MRYIDYGDYKEIGGTLDLATFNRGIDRACGIIDAETHLRIRGMADIPQAVKALCRDLIELYADTSRVGQAVTSRSQSAGSVSESESYQVLSDDEKAVYAQRLVEDYLLAATDDNGTPLLYRGGCK